MLAGILHTIETFEESQEFRKAHQRIPVSVLETIEMKSRGTGYVNLDKPPLNLPKNVACYSEVKSEEDSESSMVYKENDNTGPSDESEWSSSNSPGADENSHQVYTTQGLKQTLKDKIKFRRESEGVEEIRNLFEPPPEYKLTPEEELKNEIRKQRNRKSATKSRLKRIERENNLEKEHAALEEQNARLQNELQKQRTYYKLFQKILQNMKHGPECKKAVMSSSTAVIQPSDLPIGRIGNGGNASQPGTANQIMGGVTLLNDRSVQYDGVQKTLLTSGLHQMLKRKADDQGCSYPRKVQTASIRTDSDSVSCTQAAISMPAGKQNTSDDVNSIFLGVSAQATLSSGMSFPGKIGATCPFTSTEASGTSSLFTTDKSSSNLTSHKAKMFDPVNTNDPDFLLKDMHSVSDVGEAFHTSKNSVACHTWNDSVHSFVTVSDEDNPLQTIANTVTSSNPNQLNSIIFSLQSSLGNHSHTTDPAFVAGETISRACLESYRGSTTVESQNNNSEQEKINYIKAHLFDDLPPNSVIR